MDETPLQSPEFEPADVICGDCKGSVVQMEAPRNTKRLFTPQYYVKWMYVCQTCGLASKIFCSKLAKVTTPQQ